MKTFTTFALVASCLGTVVDAQADELGIRAAAAAPAPTPAPGHAKVNRALVRARALTADNTRTCGFADGDADSPFTCGFGSVCAKNSIDEVGGCCPTSAPLSDCYIGTQCYDYTAWLAMTRTLDDYEVACDDIYYPACVGFVSSTDTYLACGSSRTLVSMYDVATFTSQSLVSRSASGTVLPASPTEGSIGGSTGTLGADAPAATTANSNGNSNAGGNPTDLVSNATSTGNKSGKLSTGAIVGIAVAAAVVAIVGLVALGCCCWSRQRQQRRAEEARMSQAASGMGGYAPTAAGTSTVGGASVTTAVPPFQGGQPQQQQQQQYQGNQMSQQHGPVIMSMPPDHFAPFKPEQAPSSTGAGSAVGSVPTNYKSDGGANVTEIPDDPSDINSPHGAADARYGSGRGMSDAGTASVLPEHPHSPPHI